MSNASENSQRGFASFGERWKGWGTIAGAIIALAGLILGGGFFYNEIWLSKVLSYTVLPTYDVGNQAFTGLVIENRGRVNLTDVEIILADLDAPIQAMNMPGAHEPAQIISGGIGENKATIQMPRLSQGASLSIYMLTGGPIRLQPNNSFFISSKETVGIPSTTQPSNPWPILVFVTASGYFLYRAIISTLSAFDTLRAYVSSKARPKANERRPDDS